MLPVTWTTSAYAATSNPGKSRQAPESAARSTKANTAVTSAANRQPAPLRLRPHAAGLARCDLSRWSQPCADACCARTPWPDVAWRSVRHTAQRGRCRRWWNHPVGWRVKPRDARLLHVVPARRVTRHPPDGMAGCRRKHSFRRSATTGASTGIGWPQPPRVTGHRPRDRCSQARTGPTHPDERSKGHAVNGGTEETGSEADDWEIKQVGEEDTDGQVERKNGGWSCDQTRRLITPRAPVRSHLSRRRWGRFLV